jgi:hypothetical protein
MNEAQRAKQAIEMIIEAITTQEKEKINDLSLLKSLTAEQENELESLKSNINILQETKNAIADPKELVVFCEMLKANPVATAMVERVGGIFL